MHHSMQEEFDQIKMLREKELEQRSIARSLDDIPVAYELISSEWLTNALCRGVTGAQVIEHSLDVPDEGTSNRRRIFLKYNEIGTSAGLPDTVFCKATQSIECRLVGGMTGSAFCEPHFHTTIRPTLNIEAPQSLFANFDRESLNSIIVMKDMKGKVEFCDQNTKISLERAKSQMQLLATYHGAFMEGSARHAEPAISIYPTFEDWCERVSAATSWPEACGSGFVAGEHVIPARLFKRAGEVWPITEKAWKMHRKLPRTLVHGDVHLKNWYVVSNGEMGLMDWTCCSRGHWSRDLAYVIATSLTVENRRAWERSLLEFYLEQLSANGVPSVGIERTMDLYRTQLFLALNMWTGTLTPTPGAPEMQPPETSIEFIKRITHAIDDLDALDVAFP